MDISSPVGRTAAKIAKHLQEKGFIAYFAGGCVRDLLMQRQAEDYDIATTARPEDVEQIFSKVVPVGKQFGVMVVVEDGFQYEVATFRTEGGYHDGRRPSSVNFSIPEEDAKRRDFTVNGLFYEPFKAEVIDFVGGREDIKGRKIRAIGEAKKRFEEDKLRLLRAVRFASVLNFEIEESTWAAVKSMTPKIKEVSPERVRDEIVKILTRPGAARGFSLLSESGLMKEILPEIEAMKGVGQPPEYHPEGDVFIHTRLLLEKLDKPSATLALGALFHDVGKPPTYAVREGRITFYEHAPLGARMTEEIMKRLRFSNDQIEAVSACVENHMKFADATKMRAGKLKRFVSRPTFAEELEMHRIDCLSSHGMLDNYEFLKKKIGEYAAEELKPKPFLNGHILLTLGLKPGPEFKTLLDEAYDLQLEGELKTAEEALSWAKKRVPKPQ